MSPSLARCLADCARQRGFIAAAEGDRARYFREISASRRILGFTLAADDFDALALEAAR
jgi:hypothetical protein